MTIFVKVVNNFAIFENGGSLQSLVRLQTLLHVVANMLNCHRNNFIASLALVFRK